MPSSQMKSRSAQRLESVTTKAPMNRRLMVLSDAPWGHDHPNFGARNYTINEEQEKDSVVNGKTDKTHQRKGKAKGASTSNRHDIESTSPQSVTTDDSCKSSGKSSYGQSKHKSYLKYLERAASPGLDQFSHEVVKRKSKYYLSHEVPAADAAAAPTADRQVGGSASCVVVPHAMHGVVQPSFHEEA